MNSKEINESLDLITRDLMKKLVLLSGCDFESSEFSEKHLTFDIDPSITISDAAGDAFLLSDKKISTVKKCHKFDRDCQEIVTRIIYKADILNDPKIDLDKLVNKTVLELYKDYLKRLTDIDKFIGEDFTVVLPGSNDCYWLFNEESNTFELRSYYYGKFYRDGKQVKLEE